jgi:hypothetical protein
MKLFGYTCSQTPEEQATTEIELANLLAWNIAHPDGAKTDGFFNVTSTDPRPSAA